MATYRFRYFYDFCAGCLWSDNEAARERFGYRVYETDLPLSPETIRRIGEMGEWLWHSLNPQYPPDPPLWRQEECNRFNVAAAEVFEAIRTELGRDFEIVYRQSAFIEDPDLDEYLADPAGYRRRKWE